MNVSLGDNPTESIKFSFRAGGERTFYERLKEAMTQRTWLLQSAPAIPQPAESANKAPDGSSAPDNGARKLFGIAGLEMRGQEVRKNNERIIGDAFEDLEALMVSAKDIIALAEEFSSQANESNGASAEENSLLSQSASALGLATTKDMLGSETLYISELSRNLAEFLTDDTKGILRKEGGIVSLVDLWFMFNRVRNGVELVSPTDFEKAAQMWEKLRLPIRLRRFKSGVLVVQGTDRTDEKTITSIMAWLNELHHVPPSEHSPWDWHTYGRGVTAHDTAAKFGWSVGVASEELEMAEEKGALCREQGLTGLRFWENWLIRTPPQ
jgi:ESCRT-II complex subunit VPS36